MKKAFVFFSLMVMLLALSLITSYADQTGYLDVKVETPMGFDKAIMINLFAEDGRNYLTTAEPANQWKSNFELPAGKYTVDFVGIDDDIRSEYLAVHPEDVIVQAEKGTLFQVTIKRAGDIANDQQVANEITTQQQANEVITNDQISVVDHNVTALSKLLELIKDNGINILIVLLIAVIWLILKLRKA